MFLSAHKIWQWPIKLRLISLPLEQLSCINTEACDSPVLESQLKVHAQLMSLLCVMYVVLRSTVRKTAFKCVCVYLYIYFLRHFSYHQFAGTETFKLQKIFASMCVSCPLLCQATLTWHHSDKVVGMLNQDSFPTWELRWALLWIISILSFPTADSNVLLAKIYPFSEVFHITFLQSNS